MRVSENAVLNANYMLGRLTGKFKIVYPYDQGCMHEFVLSALNQAKQGVHDIDIAKALLDRNISAPSVYFPLIVREAITIEPSETETKDTLDEFGRVMLDLADLAESNPAAFAELPRNTPVGRLDEAKAAREMNLASLE